MSAKKLDLAVPEVDYKQLSELLHMEYGLTEFKFALPYEKRLLVIREFLGVKSYRDIAVLCRCSPGRVRGDVGRWMRERPEEYDLWLHSSWQDCLSRVDDVTRLMAFQRLIERRMAQKVEVTGTHEVTVKFVRSPAPSSVAVVPEGSGEG